MSKLPLNTHCYKIVFGLIKLNFSDFFEFSSLPTRGHAYKLYKSRSANVRVNFFSLVELLMYGTVYLILFVLLVLLFLRNVLELLILVSF